MRSLVREALLTQHTQSRIRERLNSIASPTLKVCVERGVGQYVAVGTYPTPKSLFRELQERFMEIEDFTFPEERSYGIKLMEIPLVRSMVRWFPNTPEYMKEWKLSFEFPDSDQKQYGSIFYVVIAQNKIVTAMWVRSYRKIDPSVLRVEKVIDYDDINDI